MFLGFFFPIGATVSKEYDDEIVRMIVGSLHVSSILWGVCPRSFPTIWSSGPLSVQLGHAQIGFEFDSGVSLKLHFLDRSCVLIFLACHFLQPWHSSAWHSRRFERRTSGGPQGSDPEAGPAPLAILPLLPSLIKLIMPMSIFRLTHTGHE